LTDKATKTPSLSNQILDFAHLLRANAYPANPSSIQDAFIVAASTTSHNRYLLKDGFKACFCKTPEQWKGFDRLYWAFWTDQINYDGTESDANNAGTVSESAHRQRMVGLAGTSSEKQQEVNVYGSGDYTALSLADLINQAIFALSRLSISTTLPCQEKEIAQLCSSSGYQSIDGYLRQTVSAFYTKTIICF